MAITNDELCYTVMRDLADVAGEIGDPMRNRQPAGLVEALASDMNTNGMELDRLYDRGDGQAAKVLMKWLKPDIFTDTTSENSDICEEEGVETVYNYDELAVTLEVKSQTKLLTEDQMRTLCLPDDTGANFRRKIIGGQFNSLIRNMNAALIPIFYAGVGGLVGGDGEKGTPYNMLYRDGLLQIDPEGMIEMLQDLSDSGMANMPILVGGGNIKKYADLEKIACCNQFGSDPSGLEDFALFYDNQLNGLIADSPSDTGNNSLFFAFAPGAAQLITKPMNKGQYRKISDTFIYDTITDPRTGIEFDFDLIYNHCKPRGYKFQLSLTYDLWQLPLDMWKEGDDRTAINYNWAFQALESAPSA